MALTRVKPSPARGMCRSERRTSKVSVAISLSASRTFEATTTSNPSRCNPSCSIIRTESILSQADEIFAKPIRIGALKELIRARLADPRSIKRVKPESVASILEREVESTIQNWLDFVDQDAELTCIPLSRIERTGHLPKLLLDLIVRLRLDSGLPAPISLAARDHGAMRLQQGYTATMVVEESRILQVSIFSTLQRNLCGVDFSRLLLDVVTIADEVDSQLKQAMSSYVTPAVPLKSPAFGLAG